jgi:hypothetical protein
MPETNLSFFFFAFCGLLVILLPLLFQFVPPIKWKRRIKIRSWRNNDFSFTLLFNLISLFLIVFEN